LPEIGRCKSISVSSPAAHHRVNSQHEPFTTVNSPQRRKKGEQVHCKQFAAFFDLRQFSQSIAINSPKTIHSKQVNPAHFLANFKPESDSLQTNNHRIKTKSGKIHHLF
jgi:hypothetical protein